MKSLQNNNALPQSAANQRQEPEYWRSLEELYAGRPAGEGEFSGGADEPVEGMDRRQFMNLLGASMALAGVGCNTHRPPEDSRPYARQPEQITPGVPLHYATSMVQDGYATGLLVQAHEGRPSKIEGNPEHPASMGASGVFEQASLLQLYDPHRLPSVMLGSTPRSNEALLRLLQSTGPRLGGGSGLHLLLEPTSSPWRLHLLGRLLARFPDCSVHFYAPFHTWGKEQAAAQVFGQRLLPHYQLQQAAVILSIDADPLASGPNYLRHAHDFALGRRAGANPNEMNRLYVVENSFSATGSLADHRLAQSPNDMPLLLAAILGAVASATGAPFRIPAPAQQRLQQSNNGARLAWANAVAADLLRARGRSVVLVGERQPLYVQAMGYALNAALDNLGTTVTFSEPVVAANAANRGLLPLSAALDANEVDTLLMVGGNPVYSAPPELNLGQGISRVRTSLHVTPYLNETALACTWRAPLANYLEIWGDARAYDGTISFLQPLIRPLFFGMAPEEIIMGLLGQESINTRQQLRQFLRNEAGMTGEGELNAALQRGFALDTTLPTQQVELDWQGLESALAAENWQQSQGLSVLIEPDPSVYDGSFANNPWLQELPKPLSKMTWDNAATISPQTAAELRLSNGDVVLLSAGEQAVQAPIWIQPGVAHGVLALTSGYGRSGTEIVAEGIGFNAFALASVASPFVQADVRLQNTGLKHELVQTQEHGRLRGRPIALEAPLTAFMQNPDITHEHRKPEPTLRAPWPMSSPQWGMSIDLSVCTGCNACVIACQAENNVPVVGKINVRKSREMHWLRIDRYYVGDENSPQVLMQPMLCQHCERAPCEYVCPVNATVHSPDGLNEMTYNRCVGTRFCSNNCPYKVRRFNWFNFHRGITPVQKMVMNPDVTVRARGVMEKCTFCVQRIRERQLQARIEERPLADGEVQTACAQSCPTKAITFGDITNEHSRVAQAYANPRSYKVLNEIGTEPRVRYLMRLRNLNPDLSDA